jgi:hypothetical protein
MALRRICARSEFDMPRQTLCCILLVVGCVATGTFDLRAEIIISEIMYNPQGTDRDDTAVPPINREWIELYNTGSSTINLGGWQLGDSQDNNWANAFPAGTLLNPQQSLVVTGDAATFDAMWGGGINRVQVGNFPTWANDPSPTNETVAIRDGFDIIRDAVNLDDANGWPKTTGSDGQSIFLLPSGLSSTGNDSGANWAPTMWGAYGAEFRTVQGENHGSPGLVDTIEQAPFVPSPDAAWSMVIIPDTQNYVKSSADKAIFTQMTEWIRDQREAFSIQVVLQEGDIVNNNNTNNPTSGDQVSSQQWQNAQDSMFVLNGHLPYIMAAGNHDYGFTNADNRDTMINNYFRATDNPLTDPANGGILKGVMTPGEIQNAHYAFTAPDGRKMLVIALEWEPRPATVAWANQIAALPEYADHTAVLLTHAYLLGNNARYSGTNVAADYSGSELWSGLVQEHENFAMTFNGHFGGDGAGYLASVGDEGNTVHQMFLNTQFETHGGDGWLRVLEFLEDGTTVRVRTYSPFWDIYRTDSDFAFTFQLSDAPQLDGDYNRDGIVDAADYVFWRKAAASGDMRVDSNGDGVVGLEDFTYWRRRYGNSMLGGSGASGGLVPEPSCLVLFVVSTILLALPRRRTKLIAAAS